MRPRLSSIVVVGVLFAGALLLRAQGREKSPHGNLAIDCGECHTAESWVKLKSPLPFRHDSTGFKLQSAHSKAACRSCHLSQVFHEVGTSCADCHRDSHRGEFGFRCESCHSPTTWTNQREMFQVHSRTRFPLLAVHARLDCSACHRNQRPTEFATTPAECGNCHYETYLLTSNPNHLQAGFSRRCEDCHAVTSTTWIDARFSHPASFPLVRGHGGLACQRCHVSGRYEGLSTDCVSCHRPDYNRTTNPNHASGGFPTSCQDCHTIDGWRPATFDHSLSGFPLTGAHGRVPCEQCHVGGRYQGTPTDCASCHLPDYNRTTDPNHAASGFPTQCENCHNTGAWEPANFDHNATRFPLTGAHDRVDCARCHIGGRYKGTPTDCVACHQRDYKQTTNPNHQGAGYPTTCQNCHTTKAWRPANFDHNTTRFPLTGAHNRVDCLRCHPGGRYTGTPTDCVACHQQDYNATTNPNHQTSGYPTTCQNCHNTGAWRPANFDHNATRFPLTGAHTRVDCLRCHPGGRYTGTPTVCVACHQQDYNATTNPNHQASGFPTTCQNCHTTNAWRPANFDHNTTRFPLTGAHTRVDCALCHIGGRYTGTPTDCVACHQQDYNATTNPNHQGSGFPTQCQNCHTTSAWRPANFNHDGQYFPIYSGKHQGKWSTCADCHINPGNYRVFECILCHEHSNKTEVDNQHQGVSGYAYNSAACYRCHPTGRKLGFGGIRRLP